MKPTLDTLPDELIIRIFKGLDVCDVLRCSMTCRALHTAIKESVDLQYHVELAISGVEDTGSRFSIPERLSDLRTIEHGWANLHFRQRCAVSLPPGTLWELFGGVLAHGLTPHVTRGLSFIQLPSMTRGWLVNSWELRDLGVQIRDFGMDPAQDLLMLIEYPAEHGTLSDNGFTIHLRTMSNGGNHPNASNTVLFCAPAPDHPANMFIIQIMGDFLAILLRAVIGSWMDQLFVWNWKTGRLVFRLRTARNSLDTALMYSFSFLSPQHIVVAVFNPPPYASTPKLDVFDFLATRPDEPSDPRPVRSFHLPHLTEGVHPQNILTRSDPSPEASAQSLATNGKLFCIAPSSRLLTVSMELIRDDEHLHRYMLFVHNSALLEYLEPGLMLDDVIVPWGDWGPTKTRLIPTEHNESTYVCYVHGTRYVRMEPAGIFGNPRLVMRDFNPLVVRRARMKTSSLRTTQSSLGESALPYTNAVTTFLPTMLPSRIFSEIVVTTLPFLEVRREIFPYLAIMIDHDCLIGLGNWSDKAEILSI